MIQSRPAITVVPGMVRPDTRGLIFPGAGHV